MRKIRITAVAIVVVGCVVWFGVRRDRTAVETEEVAIVADPGGRGLTPEHPEGWTPNMGREKEVGMNYVRRLDEILGGTDPVQRPMEFCTFFGEWADKDLEAALAYLKQIPRGNEYTEGARMVLERVQENDPERAVALAAELVTRHEEMHLYNHLFAGLVTNSPLQAVRLVEQVPDGEPRANAIRAVASVWSGTDGESALNWAANLLSESERAMAIESVLIVQKETRGTEGQDGSN